MKVRRIEDMELELAKFNSLRAFAELDKQLQIMTIGSSRLLIETSGPKSVYYNRVKGFGPDDLEKLDLILSEYEKRGITPSFDITPDHLNDEVGQALHKKGYVCSEQLSFLEVEPLVADVHDERITIVQVTDENVYELLDTISRSTGGVSLDIMERKKEYFIQPHFVNYLAYIGDEIAGLASLFVHEQEGYLANDFTFPDFRGMGCQKALIKHRLSESKRMGLSVVYTDVEFGTPSHDNMIQLGFQHIYTNSFWFKI